jgi:hypothetical protein
MQQPGLTRAVPAGILGFLLGAALVYVMRTLQQVDPVWNPGVGLVIGALFSAGFFVWGIGAFNPRLSLHGEAAEEALKEAEATEPPPTETLSRSIWQITTLLIVIMLVLGAFAFLPGGLTLTITRDPLASRTAFGTFTVDLGGGRTIEVGEFVVFIVFVIIMIVSLLLVAGFLGWLFTWLNRSIKEAEATAKARPKPAPALATAEIAGELPSGLAETGRRVRKELPDLRAGDITPPYPRRGGLLAWILWLILIPIKIFITFVRPADPTPINWVRSLVIFGIVFIVLYLFFYYVAIGLIFPTIPNLALLSAINALLIAFLLLRPKYVLQFNGMVARMLARALRTVPDALQ